MKTARNNAAARRTFTSRAADVGNALASHPVQRNGPLADESIRPLAVSQCCHSQFNPVRSTVPTNATHPCRCRRPSPRSPWARSVRTCLFRQSRSVPRGNSFPETTLPAVRWRHTRRNKKNANNNTEATFNGGCHFVVSDNVSLSKLF
jgi:hypothetical protein